MIFGLVRSAVTLNLNGMSFRLYSLVCLAACSDRWWDSALLGTWRQLCDKVHRLVSVTVVQHSVYEDPGDQTQVRKREILEV